MPRIGADAQSGITIYEAELLATIHSEDFNGSREH
jgi:hypothetical protein